MSFSTGNEQEAVQGLLAAFEPFGSLAREGSESLAKDIVEFIRGWHTPGKLSSVAERVIRTVISMSNPEYPGLTEPAAVQFGKKSVLIVTPISETEIAIRFDSGIDQMKIDIWFGPGGSRNRADCIHSAAKSRGVWFEALTTDGDEVNLDIPLPQQ